MTWFQYMTSNVPFKEKENEYELEYTVAEAIEKGIPLSAKERTYPPQVRIIKQLDGYDTVGFSVQPFEKYSMDMRDTDKQYCAFMWYISTKQQAEGLLHYIQEGTRKKLEQIPKMMAPEITLNTALRIQAPASNPPMDNHSKTPSLRGII